MVGLPFVVLEFCRCKIDVQAAGKKRIHFFSGQKIIFIASGTGIAPFHSFINSYPSLNYTLIHGVKYGEEAYDSDEYNAKRYILCTSRDKQGNIQGRVTDYLKNYSPDKTAYYYLCGNSNMIHDAYDILREKSVDAGRIHAEVYF